MKKIILAIIAGIIPLVLIFGSAISLWKMDYPPTLCVLLCRINMALCGLVRMTA
jgi:hypothetical protein